MITEEKAIEIVKKYLKDRNREYSIINEDRVNYEGNQRVAHGKYYEEYKNICVVPYEEEGYINPFTYFVALDADTGEVLYTMSKHGYVEDKEDDLESED